MAPSETTRPLIAQRLVVSVGTAYGHQQAFAALVAQQADAAGEILGGEAAAAFVEQGQHHAWLELRLQGASLLAPPLGGGLRTAFRRFDDTGEFEPDRRPAPGEALEVAFGQFSFGAGFHPAHGMHGNFHP